MNEQQSEDSGSASALLSHLVLSANYRAKHNTPHGGLSDTHAPVLWLIKVIWLMETAQLKQIHFQKNRRSSQSQCGTLNYPIPPHPPPSPLTSAAEGYLYPCMLELCEEDEYLVLLGGLGFSTAESSLN
ncbi:hypothetical protein DNTS_006361 [Danionella cerebrum]|uniref:Uncharacterized protein n=1 Tax=Danionella cerebrum TaxID=2873325 RepID=A0A553Q5G4_9TELE|nr:hypothetical protein DNTS_006361 [Danionella translucida]